MKSAYALRAACAGHAEEGDCGNLVADGICHLGVATADLRRVGFPFGMFLCQFLDRDKEVRIRLEWDDDALPCQPGGT